MRESTKRRLNTLESRVAPVEFPFVVIRGIDCRVDPDGSTWSRVSVRWDQRTGILEELDEPWELVRHGSKP